MMQEEEDKEKSLQTGMSSRRHGMGAIDSHVRNSAEGAHHRYVKSSDQAINP